MGRGLRRIAWGPYKGREGITYVKIPADYLEIVGGLKSQRQQDAALGGYVREFLGVPAGKVPNTIAPVLHVGKVIAKRIVDGALTGGIRKVTDEYSDSTQRVLDDNPTSTAPSTPGETGSQPAETFADPQRVPSTVPDTQYQYPDLDQNIDPDLDIDQIEKDASTVIDHFNRWAGTNYTPDMDAANIVRKRLSQGHTVQDLDSISRRRADLWRRDAKMRHYLTLSTLFGDKHFDEYLEDARANPDPYQAAINRYSEYVMRQDTDPYDE